MAVTYHVGQCRPHLVQIGWRLGEPAQPAHGGERHTQEQAPHQSHQPVSFSSESAANEYGGSGPTSFSNEPVTFLTDAQRQAAAKELGDLKAEEGAKLYLGDQVLSYVKEHADEPRAAESLYLVLRMIRYGCDGDLYYQRSNQSDEATRIDSLKKDVARLLRQRYAGSPWTKKAAPFAG